MQNQKSDFAQKFILEFTKELIKNSQSKKIIELEPIKKLEKSQEFKDLENLHTKTYPKKYFPKRTQFVVPQKIIPIQKPIIKKPLPQQRYLKTFSQKTFTGNKKLTIPEQKLPPQFQHIRPTQTKLEIDLGKLNPIIKDPRVNAIECNGPNIPIKIITNNGMKKPTKIILTKEEINIIINTFSTLTRIPASEGIYKVAAGNLILLSVISNVIGTKFVIKKIPPKRIPNQRLPPRGIGQRR